MQNRLTKQIIYGIFFIAFIGGIFGLGYGAIKIIQNRGNDITPVEINSENISVTSFEEIRSPRSKMLSDYVIELTNSSDSYGASKIKYSINETKGETYLLPLEKKIEIVIAEVRNLEEEDFKIKDVLWIEFSKKESADLVAQNKDYKSKDKEMYGSSISATIINKGKYDLAKVEVNVVVYNFKNEPIAAVYSQVNTLPAGEERAVKNFWPFYIEEDASNILVQASSNIMDKDNIKISSESDSEGFQFFR